MRQRHHRYMRAYIEYMSFEHFYLSNCMFNVKSPCIPSISFTRAHTHTWGPIQTTICNHFPFIWIISNKIHILYLSTCACVCVLLVAILFRFVSFVCFFFRPLCWYFAIAKEATSIYSLSYSGELRRMGSMPSYSLFIIIVAVLPCVYCIALIRSHFFFYFAPSYSLNV